MLKNRIIPCLDVKNGRVVKGINFVDLQDAGDPVEQAKIYSDGGADEICFLDITASNENRDTIYEVVKETSKKCFVPLTVGGGVRNVEDINKLLNCGADKVSINTAAVLIETLSAPANNKSVMFWIVLTPPPTVKGTKHSLAVFLTISMIVSLFSFDAVISKKQISSAPLSLYILACSTGSPASFNSTKFIPLTTLPSLTSRQGIILFLSINFLC